MDEQSEDLTYQAEVPAIRDTDAFPSPSRPDVVPAVAGAPLAPVMPKNPGMAVFASFFIPGLGTIMNGEAAKGALIMVCYMISMFLILILIGFILAPAVWAWGMVDAYQGAKKWNTAHGIVS